MERRRHGREFKLEAVRLVRERGVSVAQAARDLGSIRTGCATECRRLKLARNLQFPAKAR
jgi:transposase-like protein